jgi:hypothetical protein
LSATESLRAAKDRAGHPLLFARRPIRCRYVAQWPNDPLGMLDKQNLSKEVEINLLPLDIQY